MRLVNWLFEVVLEAVIEVRLGKPGKVARWSEYLIARRKAGLAVIATFKLMLLCLLWMTLGPSAGVEPFSGLRHLVHWTDLILIWERLALCWSRSI